MESNLTKVNSCIRELEISVKHDEVKPVYEETLNNYIKSAAIPGFRKGKAPVSMLMKMYGDSIDADFKEEVINKFSKEYFEEAKVYPISRIKLITLDYPDGQDMKFKIQFEVYPEFELKQYTGLAHIGFSLDSFDDINYLFSAPYQLFQCFLLILGQANLY